MAFDCPPAPVFRPVPSFCRASRSLLQGLARRVRVSVRSMTGSWWGGCRFERRVLSDRRRACLSGLRIKRLIFWIRGLLRIGTIVRRSFAALIRFGRNEITFTVFRIERWGPCALARPLRLDFGTFCTPTVCVNLTCDCDGIVRDEIDS